MSAPSRRRPAVERIAAIAGIVAFGAIALGCVWAALGYTGLRGESYSPLNHWISELGQEGVSERAAAFNAGLMVGGAGFVVFVVGMALTSPSRLRWAFGPIGVLAGIGGALVGVFPMNHPEQHAAAASTFFNLGWIFVGLASISFVVHREPRLPAWLAIPGAATVVAFIAFLASLRTDELSQQPATANGVILARPQVWIVPILEWATLVAIMLWVLLAAVAWYGELRREAGRSG